MGFEIRVLKVMRRENYYRCQRNFVGSEHGGSVIKMCWLNSCPGLVSFCADVVCSSSAWMAYENSSFSALDKT